MKWIVLSFYTIFTFTTALAQDPKALEVIKKFDIGYYRPQDKGLRELVVRVDVENLTKQLNEQLIFGKLQEVYFKLYWMHPNEVDVDVIGMPNGFMEIKQELKAMVASRLDLIVPQFLSTRFDGYDMKLQKAKDGIEEIIATDKTQTKMVHEFVAKFDKEGNLSGLIGRKPMATEESSMTYAKYPWSQNKWVVNGINVKLSDNSQTTTISTVLDYVTVEGHGLPKSIKSSTKQSIFNGDKKPIERSVNSMMTFTEYKANSGEASTWIKKAKAP